MTIDNGTLPSGNDVDGDGVNNKLGPTEFKVRTRWQVDCVITVCKCRTKCRKVAVDNVPGEKRRMGRRDR